MPYDQTWVAEFKYPDNDPLWFGTVTVRGGAPAYEVETAVREAMLTHLPEGFTLMRVIPGEVVVYPRLEDMRHGRVGGFS